MKETTHLQKKHVANEQGQTLLIMIFVMAIALVVGISMSNRFLTNLRSQTRTYTSYRATAVAEAALERILLKTPEELEDYITFNSCGADCLLTITNDDGTVDTATIELSMQGNTTDPYPILLQQGEIAEVNLTGYGSNADISICWNGTVLNPNPSVFMYLLYGQTGGYEVDSFAYNTTGYVPGNGFSQAVGANGYDSCFTVNSQTNPVLLRLRSLYTDVEAVVIPAGGQTIPSQGIRIEAVGQALDTTRKITVLKGTNIAPLPFDYILYNKSTSNPLSN